MGNQIEFVLCVSRPWSTEEIFELITCIQKEYPAAKLHVEIEL